MRKIKIYFIIILMIGVCNCGEKTADKGNMGEVIHLNPRDATEYVNLSEIADSIKCIKLQPAGDDVMGRVASVIIKKKYIYAVDGSQNMVFIFDKTGKFVAKLDKKGQGPGEYIIIENVFIEDEEEYIEISDLMKAKKLKYANISFELVETIPFSHLYGLSRRHNGFYYSATLYSDVVVNDKKTNPGLLIMDDKNNQKTLFDKNIETNGSIYCPRIEHFTQNNKNELFFSNLYDNTFYRLESGEAYPVYTVDFGKYSLDNEHVGALSVEKQMEYLHGIIGLTCFPTLTLNNSDIMSFSYYFKQKRDRETGIFDKEDLRQYIKIKDKVYHTKKIKNDLTNFPDYLHICSYLYNECRHEVWHEDYLVDVITTHNYFADSNVEKIYIEGLGEVTSDEEVIVVLMKLKK